MVEATEKPRRPKVARHRSVLEQLEGRGAITSQQHSAGAKFAADFLAGDPEQLGRLIAKYAPSYRHKKRRGNWSEADTPRSLDARRRFEAAVVALGPLVSIAVHCCCCDLPPRAWSARNGRPGHDGAALVRAALVALDQHYQQPLRQRLLEAADRAPRHDEVAPTPANGHAPEAAADPPARAIVDLSPTYSCFLDAWAQRPFVTDARLRAALAYAHARGWHNGSGSIDHRKIAAELRELAAERWAGLDATPP